MPSIYERLKRMIVRAEIAPEEPLTEVALAARLGVSRTPIREALRQLERDGLVEKVGRSIRIKTRTHDEILENYEVRAILETAAARSAAQRRTELDLRRLEMIHASMSEVEAQDMDRCIALNHQFRTAMRQASKNGTLESTITKLVEQLGGQQGSTLSFPGRWDAVREQMGDLVEAIRAQDEQAAAVITERMLTQARDIRLQMFASEMNRLSGD